MDLQEVLLDWQTLMKKVYKKNITLMKVFHISQLANEMICLIKTVYQLNKFANSYINSHDL